MIILSLALIIFLPAFSIGFAATGIPINNRLLFSPLTITRSVYKESLYLCLLIPMCFTYFVCALVLPNWDAQLYFANLLSFATFPFAYGIGRKYPKKSLQFLRWFLLVNITYALIQTGLLNLDLGHLSMLHSNDPYQVAGNYVPHHFVGPLYRVTGLFNESSPFVVFLSVMVAFDLAFHKNKLSWKILFLILLILLSGAKIGILFLILIFIISGNIFLKLISLAFTLTLIVTFYLYPILFHLIFFGKAGSLFKRLGEMQKTVDDYGITAFGSGLRSSSSGAIGLDLLSVVGTGYGMVGLASFLICFALFFFKNKKVGATIFIAPFLCLMVGSGSFLIVQYYLIVLCIGILSGRKNNA